MDTDVREKIRYITWYEFKKDLENQLGGILFNPRWLRVKPKASLPWNDSNLRVALSLARSARQKDSLAGPKLTTINIENCISTSTAGCKKRNRTFLKRN